MYDSNEPNNVNHKEVYYSFKDYYSISKTVYKDVFIHFKEVQRFICIQCFKDVFRRIYSFQSKISKQIYSIYSFSQRMYRFHFKEYQRMFLFHFKEYQLVFPKIFLGVVGATIEPVGAIIESDLSVRVSPQQCTNTSIFDTSMTGKGTVINWPKLSKRVRLAIERTLYQTGNRKNVVA